MTNFNVVFDESPRFSVVFGEIAKVPTPSPIDPYTGSYEVTPNQNEQVLLTANKEMAENVVIHPIPRNYGLITYNGFEITVS